VFIVDTSVVLAAVLDGSRSAASFMDAARSARVPIVASRFLRVEAIQAVKSAKGDLDLLDDYLNRIAYIQLDNRIVDAAERLPGPLRGADAIHIASAQRLPSLDAVFLTHDRRQAAAAMSTGLTVKDPVTDDPNGTVCEPIYPNVS